MANFFTPLSPVMGAGETVSSVTATNSVSPGATWGDVAGNQYVYIYNNNTVQISQGQFAVIATACSGYSVTVSSTTFGACAVGVAKNATITTNAYGWLMYRGFSGISTDNVSFVSNQAVILGLNGNFQPVTTVAGSFITATIVGQALVSVPTQTTCSTAGNNNAVFFNGF